jgi:hypothetical protein
MTPIKCKQDEQLINGKCEKVPCPPGQHFDGKVNKCVADMISCPKGQHYDPNLKKCIIDCPKDQHFNPILNKCIPDCPPGEAFAFSISSAVYILPTP